MKTSTIPTLLGPDGMTSLREYAGYHGGGSGFGGQLRAWNPPSESVDAALLPNFTRGNARADDLVRNNGYAANAIQLHQDHIVGSFFRLSHRPSWRYLGIGEEEARAFSREVEAAWKEFAEDDCCCIDVERKRTFTMMIREGVAMHAFNGELFVQATWDTSSSRLFRTQFRMVSPKRISNPNNTGDTRRGSNSELETAVKDLGEAVSYKGMYGDTAIVVYSGQYVENDVKKNFLPDNTMVLGNTQARGLRTYGCIQDADAQREGINASARYPKNWVTTGDPAREFTMIQSAPLMLLADPDAFVSVQLA